MDAVKSRIEERISLLERARENAAQTAAAIESELRKLNNELARKQGELFSISERIEELKLMLQQLNSVEKK